MGCHQFLSTDSSTLSVLKCTICFMGPSSRLVTEAGYSTRQDQIHLLLSVYARIIADAESHLCSIDGNTDQVGKVPYRLVSCPTVSLEYKADTMSCCKAISMAGFTAYRAGLPCGVRGKFGLCCNGEGH